MFGAGGHRGGWRVAVCVAAGLVACTKQVAESFCDAEHPCPTGQVCEASVHLCVLPSPPSVSIREPAPDAVLTGSGFHLSGTVSSPDLYQPKAEVSVGGGPWQPLALDASGAFGVDLPLPTLDGWPLQVSVRVADRGYLTSAGITPTVDNVAPSASLLPAGGARWKPPMLGVVFSEPISPGSADPPLVLSPAAAGRWNADRTVFAYAPLSPDTGYTAALASGAVTDQAGNPNPQALSASVTTLPAAPVPGVVLAFNDQPISDFEAAFDEDGVLSVAAVLESPPQAIAWGTFSPKAGRFETLTTAYVAGLQGLQVAAANVPASFGPSKRTAGFAFEWRRPGGTELFRSAYWRIDSGSVQAQLSDALAVVPEPGGCRENAPDTVGLLVQAYGQLFYHRAGWGDLPLPSQFAPRVVAALSPNRWEWFDTSGGTLRRQVHDCSCTSGCAFSGVETLRADLSTTAPRLSLAIPPGSRRLYVFDTSATARTAACYECPADTGPCALAGEQHGTVTQGLMVAAEPDGAKVLGAWRNGGALELLERDLSLGCTGSWTVLGTLPDASAVTKYRPVRAGGQNGLLYLSDTDHALHLMVP